MKSSPNSSTYAADRSDLPERPDFQPASGLGLAEAGFSKKIVLADDQLAVCALLRLLLCREFPGFEVVGESASARESLELCRRQTPDLLVADPALRDLPFLKYLEEVRAASPETRILVFSRWNHPDFVRSFVAAGVHGLVFKNDPLTTLHQAICTLFNGGRYLSPSAEELHRLPVAARPALTERERTALCLIAEGHSTKEMASALEIGVKTAEKYRERIMRKLDLHDAVQLTHFAIRHGLVAP